MVHDIVWLKHVNINILFKCRENPYDQGSGYSNCIKQTKIVQ